MTLETLQLPEPAKTLLAAAYETMDAALAEIVPAGQRWRLGGGTLLAARWRHRRSTDLDIFVPSDSGIATLDPRWNPDFINAMRRIGATAVDVVTNSLKFSFPSGRVEITQLDPVPDLPVLPAVADGRELAVYDNACVLTGKLHGRGARLPARDVFDVAVARHEDPDALRTAVNYIDPNLRTEIVHMLRADAGWRKAERFASGEALAAALFRFGLGAIMRREHRNAADFIRSTDTLIAGSG